MDELKVSVKLQLAAEQFNAAISAAGAEFSRSMDGLKSSASEAGERMDQAFATLGVRSFSAIEAEISKLEAAYATLARSGSVSAQELDAAWQSMSRGVSALKAELVGGGQSFETQFGVLGIRSLKAISSEIERVQAALSDLKKSGAGMDEIARASDAATQRIKALKTEAGELPPALTKSELAAKATSDAFGRLNIRSVAAIKADIEQVRSAFTTLRDSNIGFADKERASAALKEKLVELNRELGLVSGGAKVSGAAMQSAGDSSRTMASSLAHAGHVMAELYVAWSALNGAFRLSKSIIDAGIGLDKINSQLLFATGSTEAAAQSMAFVREESQRLGIDVEAAGSGFAKFAASVRGTSLEGQKARDVFSGVSEAAKVMNLSADESKGIFLALSQMMAKGKVQAEEFRGQLGDRLPIATSVAAKALGVTTAEFSRMLDAGELVSEDFLPKFAASLRDNVSGALPAAVNNLDAQLNRLKNAWKLAMQEIAQSGAMEEVARIAEDLAAKISAMSESGELQKFGHDFAEAMKTAGEAIISVTRFVTEHAVAIKNLLILYAELRALSFAKSLSDMATGLLATGAAARTAEAGVGGFKSMLLALPARLIVTVGVVMAGVEIYRQITGFIDGIIEGQRKIDEAGRKAVSPVDGQYLVRAREAKEALEEINKRYFEGSDKSAMATSKIISDFRKLAVESKGTGNALAEMLKKVNFTDTGSIQKMLAEMDTLKRSGLVTGQAIRDSIGGELKKLSTTDFVEFQNSAVRAFDGSVQGARMLGIALDASLSEAFRRLGGDIDKFRTGIDKATRDAIASFDLVAQNAQASGREIGEAFNLALKTADTRKEVDALAESLKKAAKDGVISGKDLEDAQSRLQDKYRETAGMIDGAVGDSFKRMGAKTQEAMAALREQLIVDFERMKASGQASAEGIQAAYDKMKQAVIAAVTAMTRDTREALEAAKQHTSTVQASTDAIKAQASATTAAANAQKAETAYAEASAEALKTGSAAARAKADALRVAADAAHAEADAAQASANASQAAAEAAAAQEKAYQAAAVAAKAPTEANIQAAAAAQDVANETAAAAESEKQAAMEAAALAAEMNAAASEAAAMASENEDMAKAIEEADNAMHRTRTMVGKSVATLDAEGYAALVREAYDAASQAASKADDAIQKYIDNAGKGMETIVAFGKYGVDAYTHALDAAKAYGEQLARNEAAAKRNEEATRAWQSAMDSLRSTSASLADELDRALGNDAAIEDRAYADKKRAIEEQYKAAMAAAGPGGFFGQDQAAAQAAQQEYARALANLNKLHNINMKNIADAAQEKSAADARNHADELARINEEKAARIADAAIGKAITTSSGGTVSGAASAPYVPPAAQSYGAPSTSTTIINFNLDGSDLLSEEQIRRKVVPVLDNITKRSR